MNEAVWLEDPFKAVELSGVVGQFRCRSLHLSEMQAFSDKSRLCASPNTTG
jgi:hypothetical protein